MLAGLLHLFVSSGISAAPVAQSAAALDDARRLARAWAELEQRQAKPSQDREGLIRELQAQSRAAGGGTAAPAPTLLGIQAGPPLSSAGALLRWVEITIDTSTMLDEKFLLYRPTPKPTSPRPLLVFFHGYGVGPLDVVFHTSFLQEAQARDWFLVAPMGAVDSHFSHPISQINTEEALTWVIQNFPIDTQRIYAVGFSMGGGAVTNYAARHLDPTLPMFAAVTNHTGAVALRFNLAKDPLGHGALFDLLFGDGTPDSADPFRTNRSSVIDIDEATLANDPTQSLGRNLAHIPLQIVRSDVDPFWFLSAECNALDDYMVLDIGKVPGPEYQYIINPGTGHTWGTLDETYTCDWFSSFSLQIPTSGDTLADHTGNYFHFFIAPEADDQFSPFEWNLQPAQNEVQFSKTGNMWYLRVETLQAGLDPTQPLRVGTGSQDGTGDFVVLNDYPNAPTAVLRDGQPMSNPANWTHTPPWVILFEPDSNPHIWEVQP